MSCKRQSIVNFNAGRRHISRRALLNNVGNRIIRMLLALNRPVSTTFIYFKVRSWQAQLSYKTVSLMLKHLRKKGYLRAIRKGNGYYWTIASG